MLEPVRGNRVFLPALVATETNTDQAGFIARRVTELIEEGIPPGEIAVLYRAHYHSMEVQIEFTRRGIPFSITSGIRFFEQAHVKDVAAFLKLAVNPRDETSFRRIVRLLPGIGEKTAESLWQRVSARLGGKPDFRLLEGAKVPAKAEKSWAQLVHTLCDLVPESGVLPPADMISCVMFAVYEDYMKTKFPNYEARREDLETLQAFASQFQDTAEFLAQLALLGGLETQEALAPQSDNQRVTLSTLHQAKGLEWKVVFLVWLADGMFPIARSLEDDGALEEERRLFYVGITRCMDQLYMTYPQMRLGTGHGNPFQTASRFLQDLPQELYETWEADADFPLARDMDEEIAGEDPF